LIDFDKLVEKFKTKIKINEEKQRYLNDVVNPMVDKYFKENFVQTFSDLITELNQRVGSTVITFTLESKNRYVIQGLYHRILFQKSNVDVMENIISVDIVPIYIWKGVTKHLGPISMFINPETQEVKWDLPDEDIKNYALSLFNNLVEDEDFSM